MSVGRSEAIRVYRLWFFAGADIGGISLLPTRQKRSHRKRNGGMPDLTPDDVVGFIATRLRSIDEMHEEDEDQESVIMPIASQELGHTFSPIGVRSVSEVMDRVDL